MFDALLGLLLATFITVMLVLITASIAHLLIKAGIIKDEDNTSW
jgi:hypothetical protein